MFSPIKFDSNLKTYAELINVLSNEDLLWLVLKREFWNSPEFFGTSTECSEMASLAAKVVKNIVTDKKYFNQLCGELKEYQKS